MKSGLWVRRYYGSIGTVEGIHAGLETDAARVWTYELEVSADDAYAIMGGAGDDAVVGDVYAFGVNGKGVALSVEGPAVMIAKR